MTHEIELKVLGVDAEATKKRLAELGAQMLQDTRLRVDWFQAKGTKEGAADWFLRIRSDSEGKHEVTWKSKPEMIGTVRKCREINFNTMEPEKLGELFQETGLEKYAHQEKDRTSFAFKDWRFDIDQYPGMPAYLEIEGTSEDHVQEALALLGLADYRTTSEGERTLIQDTYGLDWYHMSF